MNKVRVLKQNEIENKENEVVLSIVNTTEYQLRKEKLC